MNHADADEQVLLHGAVGAAGDGAGRGDLAEVVGHQGDVGGFECRLRAAATHRDADIRLCQRRRVVDSVADHGNPVALALQIGNGSDLVFGHQVGAHLVDTKG